MSSTKALRFITIFVAAFLFGLAWVGIFRVFHGFVYPDSSVTATPKAISNDHSAAKPEVSMDDAGFTPLDVDETNPDAFDPEGIYTADTDLDSSFADFELFTINNKKLDVACDAKEFGAMTAPSGFVYESIAPTAEESGRNLKFSRVKISKGKLSFATESLNGVSYEFDGEFVIKGNFYTLDPEARVLKGKLVKYLNGKKVAETETGFTWSINLDCVC